MSQSQQQVALPSLSEVMQQLRSLLQPDNLRSLADKLVNLYLPVAYTYVTYRVPLIARLGAYVMQTPLYQRIKDSLTRYIKSDASIKGSKDGDIEETASSSSAQEPPTTTTGPLVDKVVSSGRKVIGKITNNTLTGQVIKRLVNKNRSRISEGTEMEEEGEEKEGEEAGAEEASEAAPETTVTSPTTSESSPSTSRKVVFPVEGGKSDAVRNLPSPAINTRLEDRGPEGWRETDRLNGSRSSRADPPKTRAETQL